jgi:hypothetical protein
MLPVVTAMAVDLIRLPLFDSARRGMAHPRRDDVATTLCTDTDLRINPIRVVHYANLPVADGLWSLFTTQLQAEGSGHYGAAFDGCESQ